MHPLIRAADSGMGDFVLQPDEVVRRYRAIIRKVQAECNHSEVVHGKIRGSQLAVCTWCGLSEGRWGQHKRLPKSHARVPMTSIRYYARFGGQL